MPDPPVLLLHGFATSAQRTWRDNGWIDLLEDAGRVVVAPDLLGHGTAPKPHDPAAYADLDAAVTAQLPDEPLDGIGFSLGARVLLVLAAARPERFRRLVVAGVGANLLRHDDPGPIVRALRGDVGEDPVAAYFAGLGRAPDADPLALAALLERDAGPLTPGELGRVTVPVLVVLGDRDFAGPPAPLVEALPDAQLVTLPGTDHFATPKDFRFIDAALRFLDAA